MTWGTQFSRAVMGLTGNHRLRLVARAVLIIRETGGTGETRGYAGRGERQGWPDGGRKSSSMPW